METQDYLNKIVKELFEEEKISQVEFSKKYNVSCSTLNHILNNEQNCGFKFFCKLIKNMGKEIKIVINY